MTTAPRLLFAASLLATLVSLLPGQEPKPSPVSAGAAVEDIRFTPAALVDSSPSVTAAPAADAALVLGTFALPPHPTGIIDGDTIRVTGLKESLRMIGVDAEETFKDRGQKALAARDWAEYLKTVYAGTHPARPPKFATPMGEAAKDFARQFFEGVATVRLEFDEPSRTRDVYGRDLVVVLATTGGRLVNYNVELVRQGLSPYFVKYGRSARFHDAFLAAEKEARAAGRGIWAATPTFACYPDYEARLRWWAERDLDLQAIARRRQQGEDIILLGEDAGWERLKTLDGQPATVAGTPGDLRRSGGLGLQAISHKAGLDFMLVGPIAEVEKLDLKKKEDGNLLLLSGTVSLYQGRPQFRVETVKIRRPR